MNRGSFEGRTRREPDGLRFNEAPIHESGKSCEESTSTDQYRASMRPRFMNRGSRGTRGLKGSASYSLQ